MRATRRSLQRLLDGAAQAEQALIDQHRHLADVADGTPAVLEDARVPLDLLGKLLHLFLIRTGLVMKRAQLERVGPDALDEFALAPGVALDAVDYLGTQAAQRVEQSGKHELRSFLPGVTAAGQEVRRDLLRLLQRRAPSCQAGHEVLDL